jgi:hypothetical protein
MQIMGKLRPWADEELTDFYQHYHNTTKDWGEVGGAPCVWQQ